MVDFIHCPAELLQGKKYMKIFSVVLFSTLMLVIFTSYAADQVSMAYESESADILPTKLPVSCTVNLLSITDERNNKESVGSALKALVSGDPIPWVGAALDHLDSYGYRVIRGDKLSDGGVAMSAALTRSYVYHGPLRINGMVAIDVQFILASGESIKRKYRASGSKTNLVGATTEYMTTLNYALNSLLDKLAVDLQTMCAGNKLE